MDRRYENSDIEEKRLIVSSMFPNFWNLTEHEIELKTKFCHCSNLSELQ